MYNKTLMNTLEGKHSDLSAMEKRAQKYQGRGEAGLGRGRFDKNIFS